MTMQQLADASGVGMSTIGNIETGKTNGSDDFWEKMASTLRVSKQELLRETTESESATTSELAARFPKPGQTTEEKLEEMTQRAMAAEAKVELMKKILRSLQDQL